MDEEAQTMAEAGAKNGGKAASPAPVNDPKRETVSDDSSSPWEDDGDRSWEGNALVAGAFLMLYSLHIAINPPGGFSRDGATAGKPLLAVSNPAAFAAFLNAAMAAAASSANVVLAVLLSHSLRLVGIGPRVCRWLAGIFIWISVASMLRAFSFYL